MQANYTLDNIADRAKLALAAHCDYIEGLEKAFKSARERRLCESKPTLAIVGHGRAGKDTAGLYLSDTFRLEPPKSSSLNVVPLVAHMIGIDPETAYAERHQNRVFWINACNALRADDLSRLARWCLGVCDLAIGLRGGSEFKAVMELGVCDLSVWIENVNVPSDITVEFKRDDCDIIIENNGSIEQFYEKLYRFGLTVYRKVKGKHGNDA